MTQDQHQDHPQTIPSLKIVFAGTPAFSVPALKALIDTGQDIQAIYTQPDRPAGRGRRLTASPVKEMAIAAGLPCIQPETLRDEDAVRALRELGPDLLVVVAYGLLLPQSILDTPRLGCINVHASLLPRWRGAAPIQRCILAGDQTTGVTIMGMEAGLDTGPMYLKRSVQLDARETGGSLHDKLSVLGASALVEALPRIARRSLIPQRQDDAQATYAKKITKEEALIDWRRPAGELDRLVRAFDPWPVAQTRLGGRVLRLWGSELPAESAEAEPPGRVVRAGKAGIDVATGNGLLRITRVQFPGKRPTTAADLLNTRNMVGEMLG